MLSDKNSWLFPFFKDTLLFQIGPLVQKIWCFAVGRPLYFLKIFKKLTSHMYLGNRSSDHWKILDWRFGGWNQHVCQISLNSERVGFRIVFFLGDLKWNDLTNRPGMSNIWPVGQNRPVARLNPACWMIL